MRLRVIAVPIVILSALIAAVALAADLAPAPHPLVSWHPRPWQPPQAFAAGMRAAVDPVTGEWIEPNIAVPHAGESRAAALARVPVLTRADGSRHAELGGIVRAYSIVSIAPDAQLQFDCTHSEAEAMQRLRASAAAAPKGH